MIDRLSVRKRPAGWPIMHQNWGKLLFLHWRFPEERVRPLVPPGLEIDTYDGAAWIGITPFDLWGLRPSFFPALPRLSRSYEINVRTYVVRHGVPGIWFLSLDASNPLAVAGARLGYRLPYFLARMGMKEEGGELHFRSRRIHGKSPPAGFDASWRLEGALPEASPESLEFFLIERYCLYSRFGDTLLGSRVHHRPWPLRKARLLHLSSTLIESHGLSTDGVPLVHAQGAPLQVGVWPPRRV